MNRDMSTQGTTVVLGGTGKTGRRVAARLRARGVPTRVATRAGDRPFDWEERLTWASALQGASAVYVSFFPDLAVPGAADTVGAFWDGAR
jgi:phosphoglycerate dehydrogenase-like enzyme